MSKASRRMQNMQAQLDGIKRLEAAVTVQTTAMAEAFTKLTKTMEGMNKAKKPLTEAEEKIEKVRLAMERAEGAATGFDKRTQILNKAIKQSFIEGEKGFALGIKSFRQYQKAGGNAFEYVAEFLSSSKEELRIFGVEAGKIRKVMYGFLPPGTFRLVNKFSSSFQLIGGVLRSIKADTSESGEEFDNLFIKMGRGLRKVGQFKLDLSGMRGVDLFSESRPATEKDKLNDQMARMASPLRAGRMKLKGLRKELRDSGRQGASPDQMQSILDRIKNQKETLKLAKKQYKGQMKQFKIDNNMISKTKKFQKLITGIARIFVNVFIKYFIIISLGLIAAFVLLKAFGPSIKEALMRTYELIAPLFEYLLVPLSALWEGLKGLWNAFFGDGDFESLMDSLILILAGIVGTAIGLVLIALSAIVVFLFEFGKSLGERFMQFWTTTQDIGKKAAIIVALIVGVIALIAGAPLWVAAAIAAGAAYLVIKLGKILKGLNPLEGFQRRANGGVITSPVTMVGETGPELVSLPRGSKVHSASDTKKMMSNNINITVNAKDTSRAEMNRIANEIANIVSSKISRTTNSRTFR